MAILIVGYGKLGQSLSQQLSSHDTTYGLKRHKTAKESIPIYTGDILKPETITMPAETHTIFFMPSPDEYSANAYLGTYYHGLKNVLSYVLQHQISLKRFFFISSTAVYHHAQGEWVDEQSPTHPNHFSGQILLQAEQLLCSHPQIPSTVVRFSGIYGPTRTHMIKKLHEGTLELSHKPHYTNRIHEFDAASMLTFLYRQQTITDCYIGSDDEPVLRHELILWLAKKLRIEEPANSNSAELKEPPRGNKRCRNALIKSLGFEFKYPTYKKGYENILDTLKLS